jgi:TolB-like protein/Flp pilus assembly protein TadD
MSVKTPKSEGRRAPARIDDAPIHAPTHLPHFMGGFLEKFKRRNVGRVAILYIVVCYLILEPFEMFFHLLDLPVWTGRTAVALMVLGFPVALLLAWIYEITPEGLKPSAAVDPTQSIARQTGRKLDRAIIAVLAVALTYFVLDKFWLSKHAIAQPKEFGPHETAARAPVAASTKAQATEPAFAPPAHSIAVLPFVNMSGDTTQDYFSDGISEEILNSLSRLNALQVAARTSSFSFKGQNIDLTNIAHKLNVGAILEGSVRRTGNTVRITAQLINSVSGFHMWSQTYDRKLTDILKVQADVASAVAQQLKIRLTSTETETLELGGTQNSAAYEAYLRGAQLLANWDTGEVDLRAAKVALDQAIALDSKYALAYAKQSNVLTAIAVFIATPDEIADVREHALRAARRAVELAPELGEAHLALAGVLAYVRLDFASALPEFELAMTLSPGSANVQRRYAGFTGHLGRFQSAIIAGRRAVALDPQSVNSHVTLGQVLTFARRYDEALLAYRAAALVSPNSVYVKEVTSWTLLASGQFEQARRTCDSIAPGPPPDAQVHCLVLAYHGLGRQKDAERELHRYEALQKNDPSIELAGVYAQLGNKAAALRTLESAERSRESGLQGLRVNWELDPIRNEPQFQAIEARMNFPP